jgi:large subunit ribosomal protein L9
VTATDIADRLWSEHRIRVDRRKIELGDPVKRVGRYDVPVEVFTDVSATMRLEVVPEGGDLAAMEALQAAAEAEESAAAAEAEAAAAETPEVVEVAAAAESVEPEGAFEAAAEETAGEPVAAETETDSEQ